MLNIFANELWVIHVLFYIGMVLLVVSGIRSSDSGTIWGGSSSDPSLHSDDRKYPAWKTWQFKFLYILVAVYLACLFFGAFE